MPTNYYNFFAFFIGLPYNSDMKWLVVTSDKDREANLLKSINEIFSNSAIYFFNPNAFDCSMALEVMPSIDCCAILEKSETSFILFALGWLVGRNVQTFSLQENPNSLACESDHFHSFEDSSSLNSYLLKNRLEIIRDVNRRKSCLYLLKKECRSRLRGLCITLKKKT